ncbi:enkurin [Diachasma alloeum]|uniref:enkurin n=1 Tax=Diachasma alloeum TaxID=454923 RepID=UPI00073849BF|nr:enkurin [Diachasma alloeum]
MAFDFEESITQLIRQPSVQYNAPPRYISKFRDSVRSASMEGKSSHKTLGVPNIRLRSPSEFLRKNSRLEMKRDDINHKHYHIPNYQHKLPPWEKVKISKKKTDGVGDAEKDKSPGRNFAKQNIIDAKKLQPRKPRMYYVDDRRGSSHPLIPSGLYPLYRDRMNSKESLGKKSVEGKDGVERPVPRKINSEDRQVLSGIEGQPETPIRAEEKHRETQEIPEKDSKPSDPPKPLQPTESAVVTSKKKKEAMCRYVTDEERAELLYGMKKKFEELMHEFQVLPFLTDTPPKAKRKAKMEKDLNQLEKDIDLIERHPRIYVYEGNQ